MVGFPVLPIKGGMGADNLLQILLSSRPLVSKYIFSVVIKLYRAWLIS